MRDSMIRMAAGRSIEGSGQGSQVWRREVVTAWMVARLSASLRAGRWIPRDSAVSRWCVFGRERDGVFEDDGGVVWWCSGAVCALRQRTEGREAIVNRRM